MGSQIEVDHRETIVNPSASTQVPVRVLYKVAEAVVLLNLSRSQIYELIRSGRLRTVSQGRSRLIPFEAINDYVSLLTREAKAGDRGDAA